MGIETRFDIPLVTALALREKQIQQNYRPIIAIHKWFARRPGTLFRALMLAEFEEAPLKESYFQAHDFEGRTIADPFMGGGTPLIEANRMGFNVLGFDVNPMAAWIVREAIEHLDVDTYLEKASDFLNRLTAEVGSFYVTDCPLYGDTDVPVKYFLWVKTADCEACGRSVDLFPGYLVAEKERHPKNVLVCPSCGDLNEVDDLKAPGTCRTCGERLRVKGPASQGRFTCPHCGHENRYPRPEDGPPRHRMFAIEYYNPHRKAEHKGRFFKKPDEKDLARFADAQKRWKRMRARFVPDEEIPPGDETNRLRRWGYSYYREMFNERQLLGLELSARLIRGIRDKRVRRALATNFSDLIRYQNMLCRYDTWALKSLDIFSVHGFPVGLVQAESNLLGVKDAGGNNVGSGGWTNIIEKYAKAKRYCYAPFEVQRQGSRKVQVPIPGEWIGERLEGKRSRRVEIRCADAREVELEPDSLDAVFTDPPYFGNVQYGELMDFLYVWLRRLVGREGEGFDRPSTRSDEELTGNVTRGRGLEHFTEGLAKVFTNMARALKPGAPLAFTYHHNDLEAYFAVGVAILDAGLTCSASLPCPAEMSGSIHIHGTGSSIVDTIFVCRDPDHAPAQRLFKSGDQLVDIVKDDISQLALAGYQPTRGDVRCIIFGHLTRMTVWRLRKDWESNLPTASKIERFARTLVQLADPEEVLRQVFSTKTELPSEEGGNDEETPDARTRDAVAV